MHWRALVLAALALGAALTLWFLAAIEDADRGANLGLPRGEPPPALRNAAPPAPVRDPTRTVPLPSVGSEAQQEPSAVADAEPDRGHLVVQVLGREDGQPLPAVPVRLGRAVGGGWPGALGSTVLWSPSQWTDREGRTRFEVPAALDLTLAAGGFWSGPCGATPPTRLEVPVLVAGEEREVRLSLGTLGTTVRLHGRCVSALDGSPLADVIVTTVPVGLDSTLWPALLYQTDYVQALGRSAADGHFAVEVPTWSDCVVLLQHAERGVVAVAPRALACSAATAPDLPLAPAATVLGFVAGSLDPETELRPWARLDLTPLVVQGPGEPREFAVRLLIASVVDPANQRFELHELPAGVPLEVALGPGPSGAGREDGGLEDRALESLDPPRRRSLPALSAGEQVELRFDLAGDEQ
jgi:hypothetical protein